MSDVLRAERVMPAAAFDVVEGLVQTSLRGVDSHGARLFPHYLKTLKAGGVNGRPSYRFDRRAPSSAVLDADHTFGHAAGGEAMRHAMEMAGETGIGAVAVMNSSHFGAAAYYALMAAEKNFIGLAFTHSDALVLTYGGTKPFLGPNPICFAAPTETDPFCLDTSCSMFTWNKIRQYKEAGEELPAGVAADSDGEETTDPDEARALLPIGEYKGYGLAWMVEILCSALTGMPFGAHLKPMFECTPDTRRTLGHFFMAIRIDTFVPAAAFKKRLSSLADEIRSQPRKKESKPILMPGDPERIAQAWRNVHGILLSEAEWSEFQKISEAYQLPLPAARLPEGVR